ncbi:MAG: hypothetical protein ABEJ31_04285 [Haloarculaceae archaeon]
MIGAASVPLSGLAAAVPELAPVLALGLAAVHLFAGRFVDMDVIPRSRWLSLAGGASVGYVFVHVLPELERAGRAIEASGTALTELERHVYLVTLLGFVVFYGLERLVDESDGGSDPDSGSGDEATAGSNATATDGGASASGEGAAGGTGDVPGSEAPTGPAVFWLHIGSFAAYNALIGYLLLHREQAGLASLLLYFGAMAFHFFVNDYGLREHHGRAYRRYGRWVLAGAVLVGLLVGYAVAVGEFVVSVLFAFLAGGVILNVIKEELPSERRSRFWAFATGVVGFTIVLLLV